MILAPLQIDVDGNLLSSNDPLDLVVSEIYSILDTVLWTRVMRMDYGTKSYVLQALNLGQLISDLEIKLEGSFAGSQIENFSIENLATLDELRSGVVKLSIYYEQAQNLQTIEYAIDIDSLRG
jgi:hypothetical protein